MASMRLLRPSPIQDAFRLNAPTKRQNRAVGIVWLLGALVAATWATVLNDRPEHGAIAVTTVAAMPAQGPVVAEVQTPNSEP